jgi:nucleotide-binding universal stress UspA family protein
MYTTVLVGIDGSDADRDAIAVARHLAPTYERLILVNVRGGKQAIGDVAAVDEREHSLDTLERARNEGGIPAETVTVAAADVGKGLQDVAEREGADLMIVGRSHRSLAGRVLLGDDTCSALHRAPCAVAVAPAGYAAHAHAPTRIGVAYDGSVESKLALDHAVALAKRHRATVVAKDVIQLPRYAEAGAWSLVNSTKPQLDAVRAMLGDVGDVDVSVAVGGTRDTLQAFSETVDALFCGSRQFGTVRRVALGSTSDYLARHAACPLFVTPAHAETLIDGHTHEASIAA